MHIATSMDTKNILFPAMTKLSQYLNELSLKNENIIKIGRTHTQDATPMTVGQEFSAFHTQVERFITMLRKNLDDIKYLAIGGTAVGTGLNSYEGFDKAVCDEISDSTQLNFAPAHNKFEALSTHDALTIYNSILSSFSTSLYKIANDIRFLASGPRCGLGEIRLPENEPGSSIMPGKVNPTQCEAITMICLQVMGNSQTITFANSQGHFQVSLAHFS